MKVTTDYVMSSPLDCGLKYFYKLLRTRKKCEAPLLGLTLSIYYCIEMAAVTASQMVTYSLPFHISHPQVSDKLLPLQFSSILSTLEKVWYLEEPFVQTQNSHTVAIS